MRFVFIGGPECGGVAECEMFDLVFPLDVAVDVDDPRACRKLANNRFFTAAAEDDAPRRRGRPKKGTH